jgi:excisionase family DNA binding protein
MDTHEGEEVVRVQRLVTVSEAAERLAVTERTVRRHIETGRLRAYRIGHLVRLRTRDIDAFEVPIEVRGRS